MRIALIGTRGIPARHGGFETCVEEVGERLVNKGHYVTVYSKRIENTRIRKYKGMHIVYIPRIKAKGFETLFASFLAAIHSLLFQFDMHMVFDSANSPVLLIYKLFKKNCAINPDGLGWKRDKWGFFARKYYKWSEWIAAKSCKNIITDSLVIEKYYEAEYGVSSTLIPYGANFPKEYNENEEAAILSQMGLTRRKYFLQITRFEPENNPLISLKVFNNYSIAMKMVLVGGANYKTQYLKYIEAESSKNPNIFLPGFIYDQKKLDIIWRNCYCYIHGNYIGGTNPALLQAMAAGRPIIALDCVFNRELLDVNGFYYKREEQSLFDQISYVLDHDSEAEEKARSTLERVKKHYNWDLVASQYEGLFNSITSISAMK